MTNIEADEIVLPEGRDRTWTRRAIELLQGLPPLRRYTSTQTGLQGLRGISLEINAVAGLAATRSGAHGRKKE